MPQYALRNSHIRDSIIYTKDPQKENNFDNLPGKVVPPTCITNYTNPKRGLGLRVS